MINDSKKVGVRGIAYIESTRITQEQLSDPVSVLEDPKAHWQSIGTGAVCEELGWQ